jgi:putative hydrolase of the HAD superfamily
MKNFDISNYKNIAFDIFGVLITEGDVIKGALNNILPKEKQGKHVKELYIQHSVGNIGDEEFWKRIGVVDWKEFRKEYLNLFKIDPDYQIFLKSLPKSISTGIISNVGEEWFDYLDSRFMFRKNFVHIAISGAIKLRKPDKRAYQKYVNLVNLNPRDICYIDDKLSNLIPAKELGFTTIWFQREEGDINFEADFTIKSFRDLVISNGDK